MSAAIKGKQVRWGIPAAVVTAGTSIFTNAGIIQSFEISPGGETTLIGDEDDDVVTRIDHKQVNKFTMSIVAVAATIMPAKGSEISGASLGIIDGIAFGAGRIFVDAPKSAYAQGDVVKITVECSHYPTMAADA